MRRQGRRSGAVSGARRGPLGQGRPGVVIVLASEVGYAADAELVGDGGAVPRPGKSFTGAAANKVQEDGIQSGDGKVRIVKL